MTGDEERDARAFRKKNKKNKKNGFFLFFRGEIFGVPQGLRRVRRTDVSQACEGPRPSPCRRTGRC